MPWILDIMHHQRLLMGTIATPPMLPILVILFTIDLYSYIWRHTIWYFIQIIWIPEYLDLYDVAGCISMPTTNHVPCHIEIDYVFRVNLCGIWSSSYVSFTHY
jgi:hypothetical protein